MSDIRLNSLKQPVDVAEYLFRRLHEVGVRSVHGVPGDYNLVALDYLPDCNLNWVGSVNELNAGEYIHKPGLTTSANVTSLCCRWLRPRQQDLSRHHNLRRWRAVCH